MENNDRPVYFDRVWLHVTQSTPCADEEDLIGEALTTLVQSKLSEERFQRLLPTGEVFLKEISDFFAGLAAKQKVLIADNGGSIENITKLSWNSCRVTPTQVDRILQISLDKCTAAYVEPGEAVGAIGAQSISEPGTQMTLKVCYRPVYTVSRFYETSLFVFHRHFISVELAP